MCLYAGRACCRAVARLQLDEVQSLVCCYSKLLGYGDKPKPSQAELLEMHDSCVTLSTQVGAVVVSRSAY